MEVLNELKRIRQVMGLISEENKENMNTLIKPQFIHEQSNLQLLGRKIQINGDGSIFLENKDKKMIKLRFSVPSLNRIVNVVSLKPISGGYKIITKMGYEKELNNNTIKQILNFVDSDLNQIKLDTGTILPSLGVTKVE